MADMNIEKILITLENLTASINRAVEGMSKVESKKETTSAASEQNKNQVQQTREINSSSAPSLAGKTAKNVFGGMAGMAMNAVTGLAGTIVNKSTEGTPGIMENYLDDAMGVNARKGTMAIAEDFLKAGVRIDEDTLSGIVKFEQQQSALRKETIDRIQLKTAPAPVQGVMEAAQKSIGLPSAFAQEEGFRSQVFNLGQGGMVQDTWNRVGDLLTGKLSFSDYIRGF